MSTGRQATVPPTPGPHWCKAFSEALLLSEAFCLKQENCLRRPATALGLDLGGAVTSSWNSSYPRVLSSVPGSCVLRLSSLFCKVAWLAFCWLVSLYDDFPTFPHSPPQQTLNKMLYFLINWPHKRYSLYKALDFLSSSSSLHLVLPVRTLLLFRVSFLWMDFQGWLLITNYLSLITT